MTIRVFIDILPPQNALVAQLAEHIHGKDKVIGSIPIGGLIFNPMDEYKKRSFKNMFDQMADQKKRMILA